MAWSFGDSFDLYAVVGDALNGYWDSMASLPTIVAGRFPGSQAFSFSGTGMSMVKASAVNDAVHHIVVAFKQTAALSGTSNGLYLRLTDGSTDQCTIVFRSDGAILLTSGPSSGTTLATYTGAVTTQNTWFAFEFEISINNTTGVFNVRKNGNSVNDFTATGLNTRNSANNYANKLTLGAQALVSAQVADDLFWQSGAATGAWLGDIRCYARMPASDQSVTFSKSPTSFFGQISALATSSTPMTANVIRAASLAAPTSGTLTSLVFNFGAAFTGHAKMALYDNTGVSGGPGSLLASTVELTNPGAGLTTFNIIGSPSVVRGVPYWIAFWSDASVSAAAGSSTNTDTLNLAYTTSFPSTMAGFATPGAIVGPHTFGMTVTPINSGCVNEPQQDGLTSYVYDSNPGDADFYGVGSIASTPATVIATTTRAYMQKSDAGTRTAAAQLKSGAATVASPTLVLTTSGWQWAWRTDLTDPATGAAWTAAAVNNAQIGPTVIA